MKKIITLLLITFFYGITTCFAAMPAEMNESIAPMLTNIMPAVVNIYVKKEIPFPALLDESLPIPHGSKLQGDGVGTGVIINAKEGLIVTNAHVVSDEKLIVVTLKDGRRFRAKLLAQSQEFDIAVIQIHADHLTQISFGDSDTLKVGDFVAAIGSPYGLTQTVTSGMVSALNRDEPKLAGLQGFIQTDASINPGNSGGALINLQGKLVGINTAILTSNGGNVGIGFAIPSNMVSAVLEQLLKYGKISRGVLGVMVEDLTPTLADALNVKTSDGVLVTEVVPGSVAEKAGIHPRDVILSINNVKAHNADQLRNMVGLMRPGTAIKIVLERAGKELTIETKVGDPDKLPSIAGVLAGLRLQNVDQLLPDGQFLKGIGIMSESDESDAALAGLLKGDVILSANNRTVTTVQDLQAAAKNQKSLLVQAERGNGDFFVVLGAGD